MPEQLRHHFARSCAEQQQRNPLRIAQRTRGRKGLEAWHATARRYDQRNMSDKNSARFYARTRHMCSGAQRRRHTSLDSVVVVVRDATDIEDRPDPVVRRDFTRLATRLDPKVVRYATKLAKSLLNHSCHPCTSSHDLTSRRIVLSGSS